MGCSGSKSLDQDAPVCVVTADGNKVAPNSETPTLSVEIRAEYRVTPRRLARAPIPQKSFFVDTFALLPHPKWDNTFQDVSLDNVFIVSPTQFFCFLQQKSRTPSKFILYDVASRARFCSSTLKFSMCPWRSIPAVELRDELLVASIKERVAEEIAKINVLVFSREENLMDDPSYVQFIAQILGPVASAAKAVYVLEGSMDHFCDLHPQASADSKYFLPGPSEILMQPEAGFCLYLGDMRDVNANLGICTEVAQIHTFIQTDFTPAVVGFAERVPKFVNFLSDVFPNRGVFYAKVVELLHVDSATTGGPVLLFGNSGHGAAICAWLLTSLGWTSKEAMELVVRVRGGEVNDTFDVRTIAALKLLEGGADSRDAAIASFPPLEEDTVKL